MSYSYFDHNRNLQIHGDVNFFANSRSAQDINSFFHVSQQAQAANARSRTFERGLELLCKNTAPSARYGSGHSFPGPQCHPGTRIAVQDHIFKWLDDEAGQIAMWMNGPIGIGKSAIAQTVAHLAAERGQLSSAFFFFRSDDTRNSAKYLVPTLAYEMTQQIPHTLDHVCQAVATNPLIFSSPLDRQINSTLLRPLCNASESSPRGRMLIIIDGLDECLDNNAQQAIILSFISSLLSMATQMTPHRILIVSRPESHIASAFSAMGISAYVKPFPLDSWNTEDDIEIFLRAKLDEIKQNHPLRHYLPVSWPDYASFRSLRENSIGSFAYASTVIRYLALHNNNPERALKDLLSLPSYRTAAAFADLDALYRQIFLSLDPEICFTLQKVLCLSTYCLETNIESLAVRLSEEKSIVEIALIRVSSFIRIDKSGQEIGFHHSSFQEFLRDKERSGNLYVYSPNVASAVATALSNLWLHPIHDPNQYFWFSRMASRVRNPNIDTDMTVHILTTLVAKNLPGSFFPVDLKEPYGDTEFVINFFQAIQSITRSARHLESTYGPLYKQASNVVCAWLRSNFDRFFQGDTTVKDILDVILGDQQNANGVTNQQYPSVIIFRRLAALDNKPFDFICQLFPEKNHLAICSGILEHLALPIDVRKEDISHRIALNATWRRTITLNEIYFIVLGRHDAMIPIFCHKLEQMVLAGKKALGHVPITSKDCIFRFLYGEEFYNASKCQLDIANEDDVYDHQKSLIRHRVSRGSAIVEKMDYFIRQSHAELDFAYISGDVEALYRSGPEQL